MVDKKAVNLPTSTMKSTKATVEYSIPHNVASENTQELVEKLNKLNDQLAQQGEEYERIWKMNNNHLYPKETDD